MQLNRSDLFSLEDYAQMRDEFRARVMAHKKKRSIAVGPNATLYFEDRLTIQYQIQEMLRIEKIFDPGGINEELDTYTPLIPDGDNWKATFMIEFSDEDERRKALAAWIGIERQVWMRVGKLDKVFAICNEDLSRENEEKTASVHFMRFQLDQEMVSAACAGEQISVGIDFDAYRQEVDSLASVYQQALKADLQCT